MPPTLATARLTLSAPTPADLAESAAMWADPAVYARISPRPFTREEVWQRILRYIGHWPVAGYGTCFVRETASGRFVGEVSLMDSRRDTVPSFEGVPEAGWALARWAHGRGYAREALTAMLDWADARAMPRLVCIIDPANAASIALAERMGFVGLGPVRYKEAEIGLYERVIPASTIVTPALEPGSRFT